MELTPSIPEDLNVMVLRHKLARQHSISNYIAGSVCTPQFSLTTDSGSGEFWENKNSDETLVICLLIKACNYSRYHVVIYKS